MKNHCESPRRPRTLSERRAELELAEGVYACDAVLTRNQTIIAVERLFTFCWGDDGFDPLRQEFVALYASMDDFEVARQLNEIPESSNMRSAESSEVDFTEIPFDAGAERDPISKIWVVFRTTYQRLMEYDGEEENDHWSYRIDGSGSPQCAFAKKDAADAFARHKTRELIETNVYGFSNLGRRFEDFTSLPPEEFWREVRSLGVVVSEEDLRAAGHGMGHLDEHVFPMSFRHDRPNPPGITPEAIDLSMKLLGLLDRVVLYKTVLMNVEKYHHVF